ncbi:hypothetical protein LWI28_003679 [Acer negundo]|uniref:SRP54-type proteins GTP-binding domain-containing protein n=1 Tax=Acer negundo TaxID=4023 RepID=A0AAD5J3G4_ACENE|nr:hypothetical protein LWI28_003679 [Acer negundo]
MALAELGETMSRAIRKMLNATIFDEKVLKEFLDEISRALLQSDVPLDLVSGIQTNMKKILNHNGDCNKFRLIQFVCISSLLLFRSEKTICTKYAYYHQKQGWKPALVCANTSRAGAFDQQQQNATNAKIPFYESYTESDPVRIAVEGVERFKNENCDFIIVDTGGRHKQDASLFEEMCQVAEATILSYLLWIVVLEAAAFDQARAFKQSVSAGAVILTKMDGHAKGVGALSAVAATKNPVIFIGTGVLIVEFRVFGIRRFVSRILGMDDCFRCMDKIHEVVLMDQQPDLQQSLFERNFTLRTMYERFQKKLKGGYFGQVLPMLPVSCIELMSEDLEKVEDVIDLLEEYRRFEGTRRKMKALKISKEYERSTLFVLR